MQKTKLMLAISTALFSAQVLAVPFAAIDPRSLGMGGTGVSHAESGMAGFYNPAMLANANKEDDFSLVLPTVAVRAADADDLAGAMDDFSQGDYMTNFQSALTTLQTPALNANPTDFTNNKNAAATATQNLWTGFTSLADRTIESQVDVGIAIAIPSKSFGAAIVSDVEVGFGVVANVPDTDTNAVNGLISDISSLTQADILGTGDTARYARITGFDPATLNTNIQLVGAARGQAGLAMAREFDVGGYNIAFGVTPKYYKIGVVEKRYSQSTLDNSQATISSSDLSYFTGFNMDVGASYNYNDEYKTGVVIKDLIPQSYKTPTYGSKISIDPLVRIGGSMHSDWYTAAADLDLTENSPLGLGSKSRYLGLGAEADLWILKGRIGYRHNLSDADTSIVTAGLGLYLGLQLDLAAAMNPSGKEYAVSAQASINF